MKRHLLAGIALMIASVRLINSAYGRPDLIQSGRLYIIGAVLFGCAVLLLINAYEMHDDERTRSRLNHPTNYKKERN